MSWKEMDDGLEKLEVWTRENLPPRPTSPAARTRDPSHSLALAQRRTTWVAGAALLLGVSTLFLLL
jgi:hypothetical protein